MKRVPEGVRIPAASKSGLRSYFPYLDLDLISAPDAELSLDAPQALILSDTAMAEKLALASALHMERHRLVPKAVADGGKVMGFCWGDGKHNLTLNFIRQHFRLDRRGAGRRMHSSSA